MAMKLIGARRRATEAAAGVKPVEAAAKREAVGAPHLRLDPEGEFRRFYEHTSVALGNAGGRREYFKRLEAANPQARFENLTTRNVVQARDLHVELNALMRIEGSSRAGAYITGNSAFEQRVIVVNELPVMAKDVYDDEVAVASELADLGRICRAVGFTIFYGVQDLGEFKAKGWGSEAIFNASCNTQVQVAADGSVAAIRRHDDGQPQ